MAAATSASHSQHRRRRAEAGGSSPRLVAAAAKLLFYGATLVSQNQNEQFQCAANTDKADAICAETHAECHRYTHRQRARRSTGETRRSCCERVREEFSGETRH